MIIIKNENIIKYQGGTININSAALDALNSDLENYVSENGYGTINGVVAAAEWLWRHAQGDGELYVPYVLGGQHPPIFGINSAWYNSDNSKDGVDCTGFLFWSFKNGGYPSITIPNGLIDNMPIGINITCKRENDSLVLNIAHKLEEQMPYKGMIAGDKYV